MIQKKHLYSLESSNEFDRLERQSQAPQCNYITELHGFKIKKNSKILDAGCGSGVVSRYLAHSYPDSKITGCDFSSERIELAQTTAIEFPNLKFIQGDLKKPPFPKNTFDHIICRYVMAHLDLESQKKIASQFYQIMKPNATLLFIDIDGIFNTIFPLSPFVEDVLEKVQNSGKVSLNAGRRLPWLLTQAGFEEIQWEIETIECQKELLEIEFRLLEERLTGFVSFLTALLGDQKEALQFKKEYLECLRKPGVVLFYNKFIVQGKKLTF